MNVRRVEDKVTNQMFHDVARKIYKDDPVWVCPFDREIDAIFDPGKNTYFRRGEADRFILLDDS